MKSTGEVLGVGKDFPSAIYKGFCAANYVVPTKGNIYVSLKDLDKEEGIETIKKYINLGFNIYASSETGEYLKNNGFDCGILEIQDVINSLGDGKITFIINSPTKGNKLETVGFKLRRKAAEHRIPVFTCIDTANIFLTAIEYKRANNEVTYSPMSEYF
jgi:carbamoyl-phosphate synthase large subunit